MCDPSGPPYYDDGTRVLLGTVRSAEHSNENVKNKQTNKQRFRRQNNFARASHFFVHFIAIFARLRREMRSRPCGLVLGSPCFFLRVLNVVNRARKAVSSRCPSSEGDPGGGLRVLHPPPPFGKFSNFLSGYPCQPLFHTKNNISYNKSPSTIDNYKKTS